MADEEVKEVIKELYFSKGSAVPRFRLSMAKYTPWNNREIPDTYNVARRWWDPREVGREIRDNLLSGDGYLARLKEIWENLESNTYSCKSCKEIKGKKKSGRLILEGKNVQPGEVPLFYGFFPAIWLYGRFGSDIIVRDEEKNSVAYFFFEMFFQIHGYSPSKEEFQEFLNEYLDRVYELSKGYKLNKKAFEKLRYDSYDFLALKVKGYSAVFA